MTEPIDAPSLKKGRYRHNKSGRLYEVIGMAFHTETAELLVVYKPLYESGDTCDLFTRPYDMFRQIVEIEGRAVPRFEYIDG